MMSHRADTERLETIYRERFPQFLRVALGTLRDEGDAYDAVQDGFARALQNLNKYAGHGSFEGWVWRVVTNEILRRASPPVTPLGGPADTEAIALPIFDDDLQSWIRALPERQRLVLFLRYFGDLDYRAIAAALEVEVGTVSATLSSAHVALRRSMKEATG